MMEKMLKKLFAFDKVEKTCTFMLGVEKKFDHEKTIAPNVSNSPPLTIS